MRYKMYLYRDNRELQENRYWKCGVQSFNNLLRQGTGLVKDGKVYACKIVDLKVGKGTNPNIDIAIMFYEKAREFDKAAWCKKKKSGNL